MEFRYIHHIPMSDSELWKACENGDIKSVNNLIKTMGSGQHKSYWNYGLKSACKGGHLKVIKLMIEKGAENWNWGLTGACEGNRLNIVKLMIKKGADDWNHGLEWACKNGKMDIINLIIGKDDNDWNRGLYGACQGGHLNIVKIMIQQGANNLNEGLHEAWRCRHYDIAELLAEHGADNWYTLPFVSSRILKSDIVNSSIVNVIINNEIALKQYLTYPENKIKILGLLEFGLPIDKLQDIKGFRKLMMDIEERQKIVKDVLSDYLIKDLTGVIAGYVTY